MENLAQFVTKQVPGSKRWDNELQDHKISFSTNTYHSVSFLCWLPHRRNQARSDERRQDHRCEDVLQF